MRIDSHSGESNISGVAASSSTSPASASRCRAANACATIPPYDQPEHDVGARDLVLLQRGAQLIGRHRPRMGRRDRPATAGSARGPRANSCTPASHRRAPPAAMRSLRRPAQHRVPSTTVGDPSPAQTSSRLGGATLSGVRRAARERCHEDDHRRSPHGALEREVMAGTILLRAAASTGAGALFWRHGCRRVSARSRTFTWEDPLPPLASSRELDGLSLHPRHDRRRLSAAADRARS